LKAPLVVLVIVEWFRREFGSQFQALSIGGGFINEVCNPAPGLIFWRLIWARRNPNTARVCHPLA
jgi:hypothetical protein